MLKEFLISSRQQELGVFLEFLVKGWSLFGRKGSERHGRKVQSVEVRGGVDWHPREVLWGVGRLQFRNAHADEERSLCRALSSVNPPGGAGQRRAVHRYRPADPSAASVLALHPTDLWRTRGAGELGGPGETT